MARQTIAAAAFKAKCLALLDEVQQKQKEIIITKRGKPVAKLIPIRTESADLIGLFKGKLKVKGNILSTGLRWDAQS